jgi:putative hydrolase of the HAD superfamily
MIKCVVSDLGKVILFFDNHIFYRKLAERCSFSAENIAGRIHLHRDLIWAFDTGKIAPADFYKRVTRILDADIGQDDFFRVYNDVFSLNPPVISLLNKLGRHHKLILLSNTDPERFGFISMKFPEVLLFDEYVLSYEVGYMKPHPEIYAAALKKAQVLAGECVFLDDLQENIEGAEKIGMNAILYGPRIDLELELKRMNVAF